MAHLQKPYQPVTIKELLENDGSCPEKQLIAKIREYDPKEKKQDDHRYREVFGTEVIKKVTKYKGKDIQLKYKPKNEQEKNELSKVCDEWISNVKDDYNRKTYGVGKLEKFLDKVDKTQLQVLEEILRLRGKDRTAEQLGWSSGGSGLLTSKRIDESYFLHSLASGTYTPKDSKYAQAIYLSPKTKWGNEIERNEKTLKINYDYGDASKTQHKTDMKRMYACHEDGVPIGLFFQLKKSKYRCLGLGQIKSIDGNNFVIESFGITDEESQKLKSDVLSDYSRYYELAHKHEAFTNHPPVNWEEFSRRLEQIEEVKAESSSIETSKQQLHYLIREATEGNWVLPDFQRIFEWKKEDVRDLLESILRGYYIGTILLWNVSDDETREKCYTFPIEGVDKKSPHFTKIILDGQQRITSLNYAINSPETGENHPGYFYIDLQGYIRGDEEKIVVSNKKELQDTDTFERLLFPFKYLENLSKWKIPCRKFLKDQGVGSDAFESLNDTLDDIVQKIRGYEISTITLDVEHDAVVNVFEKVNTTGKPLDVFALMNNRLTVKGINLTRDLLPTTLTDFPKIKEYDETMKTNIARYIMESISLSYSDLKSCKRKDILEMYDEGVKSKDNWTPDKFIDMWKSTSEFLNLAIEKLENTDTGFGLPDANELPYEPMLPVLTSLIQQTSEEFENEHECDKKIRRWYLTSVFGQRYSQGVEGTKSSDYKLMVQWFKDEASIPKFITDFEKDYQTKIPFEDITVKSSAVYRGVMCLIKKKGATDPLIIYDQTKKDHMDHIFPKSKMGKYKDLKNSILNMTWLTSITNITKSAKMPKEYYSKIRKDQFNDDDSKLREVLSSHLIDDEAYNHLMEDNFDDFLESRKKVILKTIADEIGIEYKDVLNYPTRMTPQTEYGNIVMLMNALQECKKEFLWCSPYFATGDQNLIYGIRDSLDVKKIRLLTSKKKADEILKSNFKHFRNELKKYHDIKCEMRVMSKEVEREQHTRYLKDPNNCWKFVDQSTAKIGTSEHVFLLPKEQWPDFEKWWDDSYDIIEDWTDKIIPLVEEWEKNQ